MELKCFCGGMLVKFKYSKDYKQCSRCGSFKSMHKPPDDLVKFYSFNEYWHYRQLSMEQRDIKDRIQNDILDGRVFYILDLVKNYCSKGKVLEIGCAPGVIIGILNAMSDYGCYGVEPDPATCRYIERRFKITKCYNGVFPNVVIHDLFNTIITLDVFEHSYRPLKFLTKARELLNPRGTLFLQTPVYKSSSWPSKPWGAAFERLFNKYEHVYLYSETGLDWLISKAKLRVIGTSQWAIGHDMTILKKQREE